MDLDMVFNDYIKHEDADDPADELGPKTVKSQESNDERADNSSGPSMAMEVDKADKNPKNSQEFKASDASCNSCTSCSDVARTDTQARPHFHAGDSQSVVDPCHHLSKRKIGQTKSAMIEASNEPRRKRARNISKINSEDAVATLSSSSTTAPRSSAAVAKIAIADCGPSECPTYAAKKGGRFLRCDFCEKEFTHAGDLNKHRRKHTGEKPYECNQCKRKFAHASNLARHQRVHSGERPFACPKCKRTFTRRDKLAIHINAGRCQIGAIDANSTKLTILKQTKT